MSHSGRQNGGCVEANFSLSFTIVTLIVKMWYELCLVSVRSRFNVNLKN